MNDITKARYFFTTKGSKLKELQSFGLMLATANSRYRDIRLRLKSGMAGEGGATDAMEVDALIDLGVLKYMSKFNRLPEDAAQVLRQDVSLEDKREIAMRWARS
jgi:hypothetical protein